MRLWVVCGLGVLLPCSGAQVLGQAAQEIALGAANKLELHNVKAEAVSYQGREAIRLTDAAADTDDAERLAIIPGTSFQDGTIEVSLSGDTLAMGSATFGETWQVSACDASGTLCSNGSTLTGTTEALTAAPGNLSASDPFLDLCRAKGTCCWECWQPRLHQPRLHQPRLSRHR